MTKKECLAVFGIGAVGYCALELLARRRTHWSMGVAGGGSLLSIYALHQRMAKRRWVAKCAAGAGAITAIEFVIGWFVNRCMRWGVWDYSGRRGNVLGQVCPAFTLLWFLLCIPAYPLCGLIRRWLARGAVKVLHGSETPSSP